MAINVAETLFWAYVYYHFVIIYNKIMITMMAALIAITATPYESHFCLCITILSAICVCIFDKCELDCTTFYSLHLHVY